VNPFEDSLAPRTSFDLNFRLGDIPVRVHPFFWLSAVLLAYSDLRTRQGADILTFLLVWTAILLVSILVHELGHILMGRYFGNRGHIILTGFCGLAVGSSNLPDRWQRILVFLAGPAAGFLLAAAAVVGFWLYNAPVTLFLLGRMIGLTIRPEGPSPPELALFAMSTVLYINIFWGLVNLLPIWPLDGGQVCREVCQRHRGRDGTRVALIISIATAAGFAGLALIEMIRKQPVVPFLSFGRTLFPVLFFGLLAFGSWQMLQHVNRVGPDWDQHEDDTGPRAPWERDADWWKR